MGKSYLLRGSRRASADACIEYRVPVAIRLFPAAQRFSPVDEGNFSLRADPSVSPAPSSLRRLLSPHQPVLDTFLVVRHWRHHRWRLRCSVIHPSAEMPNGRTAIRTPRDPIESLS